MGVKEENLSRSRRPLGVTVLAVAHFVVAVAPLLWYLLLNLGIVANPEGGSPPPSGAMMSGAVILIPLFLNGIVTVPVGYGLIKGANVARWLVIVGGSIVLLAGGLLVLSAGASSLAPYLLVLWVPMVAYGIAVIYYLTRRPVKSYFK